MTHDPKEGRGIVARLRELLDKATPGPWREGAGDVYGPDDEYVFSGPRDVDPNATLVAALRNAAPLMLDVIEAADTYVSDAWEPKDDDDLAKFRALFRAVRDLHRSGR